MQTNETFEDLMEYLAGAESELDLDDELEPAFDDDGMALSEDDMDGEYDDDSAELFDPISLGAGALTERWFRRRKRPKVRRADRRAAVSSGVRGKSHGVIRTPRGTAKIALPGKFPTVQEFKKAANALQVDIRKNSAGIKQLGDEQRKDAARLAAMMAATEKRLTKQVKNAQLTALISLAIPLLARVVERQLPAQP